MDPTTLVTFLFKAPPDARSIELLGSWDNFRQPYRMHHDRRRGLGFWSGCFKFQNIIFDGDRPNWQRPRTGGLKQGGTYWYYYRLDDDVEAFDDSKESTTSCPLLPGQNVNVIEIPTEVLEPPVRSRSASVDGALALASLSSTHTFEPGDKFSPLDPPPISRVHARCRSELALAGRPDSYGELSPSHEDLPRQEAKFDSPIDDLAVGKRYYASDDFADDASYTSSRQSWSSVASSLAHSSVVDAYEVDAFTVPEDSMSAMSLAECPPMPSRAPPNIPTEGPPQMSSRDPPGTPILDNTEQQNAIVGLEDFHRSDFGTSSYSPPFILEQIVEDDSESDISPSPAHQISHSLQPSIVRPDRDPLRLDIHALPMRPNIITTTSPTRPPSSRGSSSSPTDRLHDTEIEYNPHHLSDDEDVWSPTFSAATVSSSGGLNTPFRISIGQLRNVADLGSDSMETVAERLRSLGPEEAAGFPASIPEDDALTSFMLPKPDKAGKSEAVKPLTTGHADYGARGGGNSDGMKDGAMRQPMSFADSIFSELSFLGTSIA